jgi:hypothetical protein
MHPVGEEDLPLFSGHGGNGLLQSESLKRTTTLDQQLFRRAPSEISRI